MSRDDLLLTGISLVSLGIIATTSYVAAPLNPQIFLISSVAGAIFGLLWTLFMKEIPPLETKNFFTGGVACSAIISYYALKHFFFNPISHLSFIQNQIVFYSGISAGFALITLSGFAGLRVLSKT